MQFYKHKFSLPTKPDSFVFVQTDAEREIGYKIIGQVEKRWHAPKYFYHLRKGGHVSALHRHKHDHVFARLDIEHFYASITRNKVQRTLRKIGFPFADCVDIAHRSCVSVDGKRILPFGYVQSPILASAVLDLSALGQQIKIVRSEGVFVSVFMDDIILSHPSDEELLCNAATKLELAAAEARLNFSVEKKQEPGAKITAFNVNIEHGQLAIEANRFAIFEQKVLANGPSPTTAGILGYVEAINFDQMEALEKLAHF
jgi:hypothetical protein